MARPRLPCPRIARGQQQLLPEQEAYLRQFFRERLAALCACAPINEQEAEGHLSHLYRVLGVAAPRIRWFDSPLAFLAAYAPQWVSNAAGTELGKSIQPQLENLTEHALLGIWESASQPIWDQVEGSIQDGSAWERVGQTLWLQVYNEIHAFTTSRFRRSTVYWERGQPFEDAEEDWVWESVYWDRAKWAELQKLPWPKRQEQHQTWWKLRQTIESQRLWEDGVQDLVRA